MITGEETDAAVRSMRERAVVVRGGKVVRNGTADAKEPGRITPVLDAGAFRAAERGDRGVLTRVKVERRLGRTPLTNGGVAVQVWRGGRGKQVRVARLLGGTEVTPVDDRLGNGRGCRWPRQEARTPSAHP